VAVPFTDQRAEPLDCLITQECPTHRLEDGRLHSLAVTHCSTENVIPGFFIIRTPLTPLLHPKARRASGYLSMTMSDSDMLEGFQRQPPGDVFVFHGNWRKIRRKHRVIG
jgi:hypothetical protein